MFIGFVGTINPSSGDLGVLVPLEQAMLAGDVSDEERTRAFARYSLIGALLTALGTLAAASPDFLRAPASARSQRVHADVLCLCGARACLRVALLAAAARAHGGSDAGRRRSARRAASSISSPRCSASMRSPAALSCNRCWRFGCSSGSISHCRPRACSFSGRASLSALSFPVAAWLSRRIGLVNTMVFTHMPVEPVADPGGVLVEP